MKNAFFVVVVILLFSSSHAGQIYKWTDDKGVIHFSDSPVQTQGPVEIKQSVNNPTPTANTSSSISSSTITTTSSQPLSSTPKGPTDQWISAERDRLTKQLERLQQQCSDKKWKSDDRNKSSINPCFNEERAMPKIKNQLDELSAHPQEYYYRYQRSLEPPTQAEINQQKIEEAESKVSWAESKARFAEQEARDAEMRAQQAEQAARDAQSRSILGF
ncbi:MAG: DUF4124 domain-containing protein [Deltaproteobacteria bacterium]|nr:DUF4124 domain-containing protein [Deltaproteobacteria bacterium]